MSTATSAVSGGFANPVFDAQGVFRRVMDAMARPGTIRDLSEAARPPAPLGRAAGAIALTLCDHDTRVYLSATLQKAGVGEWLGFHTGAALTREKVDASFAFFEAGAPLAPFGLFSAGTQEYPDRSTTVVIEVAGLEGGEPLTLSGPGIRDKASIAPLGLPDVFLTQWMENRRLFPRGIDLILTSGDRIVCLPRTTRISREG